MQECCRQWFGACCRLLIALLQALDHFITYCMSHLSRQCFTLRPCLLRTLQICCGLRCGVSRRPVLHLLWQRHTNRLNLNTAVDHTVRQDHLHSLRLCGAECLHTVRAASVSLPFIRMFGLQAMQMPTGRPGEWGDGWLPSAGRLHFGPPGPADLVKQPVPRLCASQLLTCDL